MRWIILITGFGQTERRTTGLMKLMQKIQAEHGGPKTMIILKSWKDNMADLAEWIFNEGAKFITIIGYSYGGYSAKILLDQLYRRGIRVNKLFMLDAVWRWSAYLPAFTSLLKHWKIKLVDNVDLIRSWRQTRNKPAGHQVVPHNSDVNFKEMWLHRGHGYMDDAPEIHAQILAHLRT